MVSSIIIVACAVATGDRGPGFDHVIHAENDLECTDCHRAIAGSDGITTPDRADCADCHAEYEAGKPPGKYDLSLFASSDSPWQHVSRLPDERIFSHQDHVAVVAQCRDCHVGITGSRRVDKSLAVTMDACVSCHTEQRAANECQTCHRDYRRDRPPPSHRGEFLHTHGRHLAFGGLDLIPKDCAICHLDRSSCDDCHRDRLPRNHTNHWRLRGHGMISALDRKRCSVCHQTGDMCMRCHQQMRPLDHRASYGAPMNRHCVHCHLPLRRNRCAACHQDTPGHDTAPQQPRDTAHKTNDSAACRNCHRPLSHLDNRDDCTTCHR